MDQILYNPLNWILCICIAFFSSTYLTKFFISQAQKLSLLDNPNHRSLHSIPTARGGGVVFVCLILIFSLLYLQSFKSIEFIALWVTTSVVACLGFLDDLYSLSAKKRILVQLSSAIYFTTSYLAMDPRTSSSSSVILIFTILVSIFILVWSINIFNFMDGSDGLAVSQAILVLIGYILSFSSKDLFFQISCITLSSLFGFLIWNFPKAKVFMGDCGSGFLGCLIGCLWIHSIWIQNIDFSVGFLILYSPFIFDTSITLVRRFAAGESWYSAHRMHAYQRLVHQAKFSHLQLLFFFFGLSCIHFALFLLWMKYHSAIIVIASFCITLLAYILVEYKAPLSLKAKT